MNQRHLPSGSLFNLLTHTRLLPDAHVNRLKSSYRSASIDNNTNAARPERDRVILTSDETDPLPGVRSAAAFRLKSPDVFEKFRRAPTTAYEIRVFMASAELKNLFEELFYVIALIPKAISFPELTAVLKLYIISWVSLSDVLASVLNAVYDLGIDEQDIEFGAILRNAHIASSELPAIVKKHTKSIRHGEFKRMRNNIVHRGKLAEDALLSIHTDFLMGIMNRLGGFTDDEALKAAATQAAREEARVEDRVRQLMEAKQIEYRQHLDDTKAFLREIARVLVDEIQRYPS